MRSHNSNPPQPQPHTHQQQVLNNTDWSAATPAASSTRTAADTSRQPQSQPLSPASSSSSSGSYGSSISTSAGSRVCAEACTHTFRLAVADLESRALAAVAAQPSRLQSAVDKYLQQHLAGTLRGVLTDMIKEETNEGAAGAVAGSGVGTEPGAPGGHPLQPLLQPHQLAAHALRSGHMDAGAAASGPMPMAPFVSPRQPPAATVVAPLVDSPAVLELRETLSKQREELADAESVVLEKDASLSTSDACAARLEELESLKAAGSRLTVQQRSLASALEILRDTRADVDQLQQELTQAEQLQEHERQQMVLEQQRHQYAAQQQQQQQHAPAQASHAPSPSSAPVRPDYTAQMQLLARLGHEDAVLNLALLDRFNGDVMQTDEMLKRIPPRGAAAPAAHAPAPAPAAPSVDVNMRDSSPAPHVAPSVPYSPHYSSLHLASKPEPAPAAYSPRQPKAEPFPSRSPSSASVSSSASGSSFVSVPSSASSLAPGHAPQSCAEALSIDGGRQSVPAELLILYQCGFRAFDFSYRTSAVNHLKSVLRDKLHMGTEQLATGVWHHRQRYNDAGVEVWSCKVDCIAGGDEPAQEHHIVTDWSQWTPVKTGSTEEAAVMALRFMQRDTTLKKHFIRPAPPRKDLNPVSAVRNAIRDRSAWKGLNPPQLDEQMSIQQGHFHCRLMLGDEEIGVGRAADKNSAKAAASKNAIDRWNDAIEYIERQPVAVLQRFQWLDLAQLQQ